MAPTLQMPAPRRTPKIIAPDAMPLLPPDVRPGLAALGDGIVTRLPLSLQRDLATGSDRAVVDAAEAVGAVALGNVAMVKELLAVPGWALGRGGLRAGDTPRTPYEATIDRNGLPRMPDMLGRSPAYGFGDPSGGAQFGGFGNASPVRRLPFAIWAGTNLSAGQVENADSNDYTNTSQRRFVITHVSFSQNNMEGSNPGFPLELAPLYRVKITPSVTNRPWSKDRVLARSYLSNMPYGNVPNVTGYQTSRWAFPYAYVLGRNAANYVAVGNEATDATAGVAVALIGYKRDAAGTPRVFFDATGLAQSSSGGTPLNGQLFRGDGDFDVEITDLVTAWQCVTPSSPLVFVRPDQASQWMASATPAAALNNVPGMLGAYWELRRPQLIEPATTITIELEGESDMADVRANVGFVGYIEDTLGGGQLNA